MKSIMSAALIFFICTAVYAQDVTFRTEKKQYKIDEAITLIFEVKATVDSETPLKGTNFTLIDGPRKRLATTTNDGQTSTTFTSIYTIKAISPGIVEVISPIFRFNNQEKSAGQFSIKVTSDKLTETEIDEIKFNKFKENAAKQKDVVRYVIFDDLGFTEKFNGSKWEFIKRLSKEEISSLSKE